MRFLLQAVVGGMTSGIIYAVVAMSFSALYSVTKLVNLATGEFFVLASFLMMTFWTIFLLSPLLSFVLSLAIVILVSIAMEKLVIRPIIKESHDTIIVMTIGVSIFLQGLNRVIWGTNPLPIPAFSGEKPLVFGEVSVPTQMIWLTVTFLVLLAGLQFLYKWTWIGKSMIACSQNREEAGFIGINVIRITQLSFIVSASIAAITGMMATPIIFVAYNMGLSIAIKAFLAAVLGGLENPMGGAIFGILLGLSEALFGSYISTELKDIITLLLLMVVLIIKSKTFDLKKVFITRRKAI